MAQNTEDVQVSLNHVVERASAWLDEHGLGLATEVHTGDSAARKTKTRLLIWQLRNLGDVLKIKKFRKRMHRCREEEPLE